MEGEGAGGGGSLRRAQQSRHSRRVSLLQREGRLHIRTGFPSTIIKAGTDERL